MHMHGDCIEFKHYYSVTAVCIIFVIVGLHQDALDLH